MDFKRLIFQSILISIGMSVFLSFYLKVSQNDFFLLVLIELTGIFVSRSIARGKSRTISRVLITSLIFAGAIVFFLKPEIQLGFESTFLILVAIQVFGFMSAGVLARQ